ncbi:hypothetical protein [Paenibacillus paeoniae]|nr:hypothetical protein [Paenibacillus paeoniae]
MINKWRIMVVALFLPPKETTPRSPDHAYHAMMNLNHRVMEGG